MATSFQTRIPVRYRDTDSMGHVSSPVYYDYLQHAYLEYMFALLGLPRSEKLPQIMVKTSCEYVAPAFFGDVLIIESKVTGFGNKSFEMEHIFYKDTDERPVIARTYSKHVMFDYDRNTTVPVSAEFRDEVNAFQDAVELTV
ncbi:thioesterase [Novacetimonas maltaceti]|uniref:Acyl-CoA thioesterase n=3 Tax=Acetobacteraceae TaxID=433 RepID=A0A2S3VY19_9PROT|nr:MULTISPECIES: acyl-CoA thioesterase [Acetobacteraceae]POF61497.1 hypothetical protein KMAL_28920 [Novacetimonas maltaceti]PYD58242.1 thioesterase [Novacetimonas maltaceti]